MTDAGLPETSFILTVMPRIVWSACCCCAVSGTRTWLVDRTSSSERGARRAVGMDAACAIATMPTDRNAPTARTGPLRMLSPLPCGVGGHRHDDPPRAQI